MFDACQPRILRCFVVAIAFLLFRGNSVSSAEEVKPLGYAIGIPRYFEEPGYFDHAVLKVPSGGSAPKYYLLFSYVELRSRGTYPDTSVAIYSQVFRIDFDAGKFLELRDEKQASEVISKGILAESSELDGPGSNQILEATNHVDNFINRKCNFLSTRFWAPGGDQRHESKWYFLRMSTYPMPSDPVSSFGCENLGRRAVALSQIAMLAPAKYSANGKTFLVDVQFPLAIWFNGAEEHLCFIQTLSKGKENEQKVLHLFDNRSLPELFHSKLESAAEVRRFQYWFAEKFDQTWASLVRDRNCTEIENDSSVFAALVYDNNRVYVKFHDQGE